jgi:hypothetical protein
VRVTQREMQEALDMTPEEMDLAAHELINQRGPRLNKSSDIDRYKQQ